MYTRKEIKTIIQVLILFFVTVKGFAHTWMGFLLWLGFPQTGTTAIVIVLLTLVSTGALFVSIWRN